MANHPNRSRSNLTSAATPQPEAIRAARAAGGHTEAEAAALIYDTEKRWRAFESGERRMHPALFELYKHKAGVETVPSSESLR